VILRSAVEGDLPALLEVFETSVRTLGPQHYSPAQVEAWAYFARETERFRGRTLGAWTVVAEERASVLGFATLEPDGELGLLFVRPEAGRRGIGSALVMAVLEEARGRGMSRVHTVAGEFSQGLFRKHGFQLVEQERVKRRGAKFTRYRMAVEL
jgi:putative acetyltransferase